MGTYSWLQVQVDLKKKKNQFFSKLIITADAVSSARGKPQSCLVRLLAALLEMHEFYWPRGFYPICFINDLSEVNKRKLS